MDRLIFEMALKIKRLAALAAGNSIALSILYT